MQVIAHHLRQFTAHSPEQDLVVDQLPVGRSGSSGVGAQRIKLLQRLAIVDYARDAAWLPAEADELNRRVARDIEVVGFGCGLVRVRGGSDKLDQAGVKALAQAVMQGNHDDRLELIPVAGGKMKRAARNHDAIQILEFKLDAIVDEHHVNAGVINRLLRQPHPQRVALTKMITIATLDHRGYRVIVSDHRTGSGRIDALGLVDGQAGLVVVVDLDRDAGDGEAVVARDAVQALAGNRVGQPLAVQY